MKGIRVWIDFVLYPLVVLLALQFGPRDLLWVAGLTFSLAAALLWFIARRQLGKSFSVDAEARQLVTRGCIRKSRHPVYLFGDLAYLGALLALRSWIGLLLWLLSCCRTSSAPSAKSRSWRTLSVPITWRTGQTPGSDSHSIRQFTCDLIS